MDHITSNGMPTVCSSEEMTYLLSSQLLRPMYPGQFPSVRHNLFNIVLVVDFSHSSTLQFVAGSLSSIIYRGFPFRFGIVPIAENEEGECC
jgi:UDP-glucose:glycoprotein glucosyltransferase